MGYLIVVLLAVAGLVVFLVRSPAFRAYRRNRKAIDEDGMAHRQRHQDPRLP